MDEQSNKQNVIKDLNSIIQEANKQLSTRCVLSKTPIAEGDAQFGCIEIDGVTHWFEIPEVDEVSVNEQNELHCLLFAREYAKLAIELLPDAVAGGDSVFQALDMLGQATKIFHCRFSFEHDYNQIELHKRKLRSAAKGEKTRKFPIKLEGEALRLIEHYNQSQGLSLAKSYVNVARDMKKNHGIIFSTSFYKELRRKNLDK